MSSVLVAVLLLLAHTIPEPARGEEQAADGALLQRIARGEQAALLELYDRYGNLVFSLVLRTVRSQVIAEEVTQDTFLKVWHNPERWDAAKGKFSSWLLAVAHHAAIDHLRREQRHTANVSEFADANLGLSPAANIASDPLWHDGQLLRSLIDQLPAEQAHLIDLAFYHGLTHSQIAEALALPLGTVKTRLRLGLQKLRALWLDADAP